MPLSKTKRITLAIAAALMTGTPVSAQANDQETSANPSIVLAYYKIKPNRLDDWIKLFKTWHVPIIEDMKKDGSLVDVQFFTNGHRRDWDFFTIITRSTEGQGPKTRISQEARARKLFPDFAAYERGEKERWDLTVEHWDDIPTELELDEVDR